MNCSYFWFKLIFQFILIFTLVIESSQQTNLTVNVDNKAINAIANYRYDIAFANSMTNRTYIVLRFPPEVTLFSTGSPLTTVSMNGANLTSLTVYPNNSTINITVNVSGNPSFTISNVKNPPSAIFSINFLFNSNNINDNITTNIFRSVQYVAQPLISCFYQFSGTTEQSNSTLDVMI